MTGKLPDTDPLRGLRSVFAVTLVLQAILAGLALLVVIRFGGGLAGPAGWYTAGLALGMLAAAGAQGRPWGLKAALALQVAMIAGGFVLPVLGAVGLLFALVWAYLLHLRRKVVRRLDAAARGDPAHGA